MSNWGKVFRIALGTLAAAAVISTSSAATEEGPAKLQIRNFDHFEFDTVTGSYFGIAGFYTSDEKVVFRDSLGNARKVNQESATAEIRLVMGGESFQGGVVIPYHITGGDNLAQGNLGSGQDEVGDIRAHLKFIALRKEFFDLGAGLMLTFPGGGESVGISTGSIGVLPFLTSTAHLGPVDLNVHVGYNFMNHNAPDGDSVSSLPILPNGNSESILYGGSVKFPILDVLGLRLELAGQEFNDGAGNNVLAIQPGIDYLIHAGKVDLQLSASGSYGLTGGAAGSGNDGRFASRWGLDTKSGLSRGEWGGGLAFGVLWN